MPQEVVHPRGSLSLERVILARPERPIYTPGGDPRGSCRKRDCWGAAAQVTREREAGESHRLSLLLSLFRRRQMRQDRVPTSDTEAATPRRPQAEASAARLRSHWEPASR